MIEAMMAQSNRRKELTRAALLCLVALAWILVMPRYVRDGVCGSLTLFGPPVMLVIAASLCFGRSFF